MEGRGAGRGEEGGGRFRVEYHSIERPHGHPIATSDASSCKLTRSLRDQDRRVLLL